MVLEFYERYFKNESEDVGGDLRLLFNGFVKNVNHPQMILCTLKNLSRLYTNVRAGFIGTEELTKLYEIINTYFIEQFFSNKYLCFKYILQMLALYIDLDNIQNLDWSQFFKVIGKMPLEFFSTETIFIDEEALKFSALLVDKIGTSNL